MTRKQGRCQEFIIARKNRETGRSESEQTEAGGKSTQHATSSAIEGKK